MTSIINNTLHTQADTFWLNNKKRGIKDHRWPLLFLTGTFGLYFIVLLSRLLFFKDGNLHIGHEHAWSDWPLHIAISHIFAFQPSTQWFEHHPMYAHGGLQYTFLTNFISGMLMKVGLPLKLSFILPSILYSLTLIIGLYALFSLLLRSKLQATLAVSLFFLSSGLGFLDFLSEFIHNPSWNALTYPVEMYSREKQYDWHSGNVISGLLIPQRSFLLGMTIGVWTLVLFLLGRYFSQTPKQSYFYLLTAGVLAGVLPLAHMHSFLIVGISTAVLCIRSFITNADITFPLNLTKSGFWKRDISWLLFSVPATLISFSLYFIFFYSESSNSFMSFFPLWQAKGNIADWLLMWLKLWGILIPLSIIGMLFLTHNSPSKHAWVKTFCYTFVVIFLLANMFLIQPVAWDNSKIFFWCYLVFLAPATSLLSLWWSKRSGALQKVTVIACCLTLCLTGLLELIRLQRTDIHQYQIISKKQIDLANRIRTETDTSSVFLTSSYVHQFIMVWAPRPILLGFKGWMANFGFDYNPRNKDIADMYQGKSNTNDLLKKYKVSYVVIGRGEKKEYKAEEAYYKKYFPLAFSGAGVNIYDVRKVGLNN